MVGFFFYWSLASFQDGKGAVTGMMYARLPLCFTIRVNLTWHPGFFPLFSVAFQPGHANSRFCVLVSCRYCPSGCSYVWPPAMLPCGFAFARAQLPRRMPWGQRGHPPRPQGHWVFRDQGLPALAHACVFACARGRLSFENGSQSFFFNGFHMAFARLSYK